MRRGTGLACVVWLLAAGLAVAQAPRPFEDWSADSSTRQPSMRCGDLRSLSGFEYAVDSAADVADRPGVPEFCHIEGLIQPEVRFHVSLPRAWNGRLYMFGNGGFAGESLSSPGRLQRRDAALSKGFAVVSTNTGHDAAREPLATFAVHPQKLSDYAYRAVHVSVLAAKSIARHYYGAAPNRSYFEGCSTGGRQGLIAAQRFPEDFDGIVVGAPVLDFSGTMLHYAQFHRALREAPALASKVEALSSAVYAKCDGVDGVTDGLIEDPRACRFDAASDLKACPSGSGSSDCFTAEEITAVQAVYADLSIGGESRFPGFPVGPEAGVSTPKGWQSGWDPWIVRGDGQPAISRLFMESFFKHMVTPGTEIDWTAGEISTLVEKAKAVGTLLNATDPDLGRFRSRGGRILMYYGWADPALNPLMGVHYYERVRQTMGEGTSEFFRLFMMPGVFHCTGGVGPDRADMASILVRWAEGGAAPDRIVASRVEAGKVTRTRPLCPYPQVARYTGKGSIDEAANFVCGLARRDKAFTPEER
jgi:feruloyl esterase